jgi:hypothetical protein
MYFPILGQSVEPKPAWSSATVIARWLFRLDRGDAMPGGVDVNLSAVARIVLLKLEALERAWVPFALRIP